MNGLLRCLQPQQTHLVPIRAGFQIIEGTWGREAVHTTPPLYPLPRVQTLSYEISFHLPGGSHTATGRLGEAGKS